MTRARTGTRPVVFAGGTRALIVLAVGLLACHRHVAFDQGGCDDDSECGLATLHCDAPTAACVECANDDQCAALGTARVRCDTAAHRCVECGTDGDCGQGRGCRSHHCVTLCDGEGPNSSCPSASPYCEDDDSGICVQCGDDLPQGCSGGGVAGPICGHLGLCVACQVDGDCHSPTPHCETFGGRCVECVSTNDCASGTVCDPTTNHCVAPQ